MKLLDKTLIICANVNTRNIKNLIRTSNLFNYRRNFVKTFIKIFALATFFCVNNLKIKGGKQIYIT